MKYNLWHILNKLKRDIGFHVVIVLQLTVCLSLIILGISDTISYEKKLDIVKNSHSSREYMIQNPSKKNELKMLDGELENVLEYSEKNTKNLSLSMYVEYLTKDKNTGHTQYGTFVIANSFLFREYLFLDNPRENVFYMSEKTYKKILNGTALFFSIEDGFVKFNNKKYDFEIHDFKGSMLVNSGIRSKILDENSVMFHSKSVEDFESLIGNFAMKYYEKDVKVDDFLREFKSEFPKFSDFVYLDVLSSFKKNSAALSYKLKKKYYAAYFAFISIVFGIGGLFLVFIENRKKEYAISLYLGAKNSDIKLQLYFELFIVFFISFILAIVLSLFIEKNPYNNFYYFEYSSLSFILSILICVLVPFLIVLLTSSQTKSKTLIKHLKL